VLIAKALDDVPEVAEGRRDRQGQVRLVPANKRVEAELGQACNESASVLQMPNVAGHR
jgi:hypothetical protein